MLQWNGRYIYSFTCMFLCSSFGLLFFFSLVIIMYTFRSKNERPVSSKQPCSTWLWVSVALYLFLVDEEQDKKDVSFFRSLVVPLCLRSFSYLFFSLLFHEFLMQHAQSKSAEHILLKRFFACRSEVASFTWANGGIDECHRVASANPKAFPEGYALRYCIVLVVSDA